MLLNVHSWYSLRYGTIPIEDLPARLKAYGYDTAVITDINNSTGALEFIRLCRDAGIRGIAGMEFRKGDRLLYFCIARNNAGFAEMNASLTDSNINGAGLGDVAPEWNHVYVVYPFGSRAAAGLRDYEFIGVQAAHLTKVMRGARKDFAKYVIWQPVTFLDRAGGELHCQLRAVNNNILRSQLRPEQAAGAEETLCTKAALLQAFKAFPDLIRNTEALLADCSFSFDFKEVKNRKTYTGNAYDDRLLLEKLALDGWKQRYGAKNGDALTRIRRELAIIEQLHFSAYFLLAWDVVRYSMSRGFFHVGRGSGANSIVAYCLKITDVCPLELDLYFERFLNPKRTSPPDFDIDFSWRDRDEVFDYIFKRYGHQHTALLGAMSTFRDKSIIRELGKTYGLPKGEIDRLIEEPESAMNRHEIARMIMALYTQLVDFPNLRSIHAGGVLITELPICNYIALDLPPKNFPVAQFDMYGAEAVGIEKLDILSQRGLGHIRECADLVWQNRRIKVDVHDVASFKQDAQVREKLRAGDTIGCFYIESPAMRALLRKLACDNYPTLVAASSIIRPGVARSGMMKSYITYHRDPSQVRYLHPVMEAQLKETYGVMVYQEDVLKVGHHYGGLDLADADVLRRLMSGKNRGKHHLVEIEERFFANCHSKGYDERISREVWRQIESFAGYSFSKAHSASYAVESYQSLYLKAHYPLEFATAVINNFGGFYSTRVYVAEAQKCGAKVHLPCVNHSQPHSTIRGRDIYLGFIHIQNLQNEFQQGIALERGLGGTYRSLEEFVSRTRIPLDQLILLIRIGALRFTGRSKKRLLWEAHSLLSRHVRQPRAPQLFEATAKTYELPDFAGLVLEDAYDEIELLGFPLSLSMFELIRTTYRGEISAAELPRHVGRSVRMLGNYVAAKYVRTVKGTVMNFGTFLDEGGDFFDTTHFPQSLQQYPFRGAGVYLLEGLVTEDFGVPSIEVSRMGKLPIKSDPRSD